MAEQTTPPQSYQQRFAEQHEKLIPIVAVADMFYGCNKERGVDKSYPGVDYLVTKLDKNTLAEKLNSCLKGESPNSDLALNYGLIGCFDEQLKGLPEADRAVKQKLVRQAINKLSKEERKKSFTHCVTDQAISYLK